MQDTLEFNWTDRFLLGHEEIDDTHREFVDCVNGVLAAPDGELAGAFDALIAHAEQHFGQENAWLSAPDFPGGGDCHIEEHDKVLTTALEVRKLLGAGDAAVARRFARALADWFPGHADYMDSALATWLVKKAHNGRPLVFRRKECV